jgi:hypothetical protein
MGEGIFIIMDLLRDWRGGAGVWTWGWIGMGGYWWWDINTMNE